MNSIGLVPELLCKDLDKSLSFYVDILGFELLYKRDEEKFAYLKKGNAEIMLEQVGVGRNWITGVLEHPYGRGINFQIQIQSADELYGVIQKHNITPFLPLEEKWYRKDTHSLGNRQFIIQDPDGYLLRFYEDLGKKPL